MCQMRTPKMKTKLYLAPKKWANQELSIQDHAVKIVVQDHSYFPTDYNDENEHVEENYKSGSVQRGTALNFYSNWNHQIF